MYINGFKLRSNKLNISKLPSLNIVPNNDNRQEYSCTEAPCL